MKKIILLLTIILYSVQLLSQNAEHYEAHYYLEGLGVNNFIVNKNPHYGGIIIPRITTKQRDAIITNNKKLPDDLLIYNTDTDHYNYYSIDTNEWLVCDDKSIIEAKIEIINTSDIISGQYLTQTPLGSDNYLAIPVKVIKPGYYTITGFPTNNNGYHFTVTGKFMFTGNYIVVVPGMGTPINFSPLVGLGDEIRISINNVYSGHSTRVKVGDSRIKPMFSIICDNIQVYGTYIEDKELDKSNYVEVILNVDNEAIGSSCILQTNIIDGVSFKGQDVLLSAKQKVKLYGEGVPISSDKKEFTITTNSQKTLATCFLNIDVEAK